MIKLLDILENKILIPRRSPKEREKNYLISIQKKIQQYIKDGSKGDLYLPGIPITSLPDNLEVVGGSLSLEDTSITFLPDNLKVVEDSLYARYTSITSLPDNLKVGEHLFLEGSSITSLPNNLKVGGDLYLELTPLSKKYSKEEIRKMVPGVKGNIYL